MRRSRSTVRIWSKTTEPARLSKRHSNRKGYGFIVDVRGATIMVRKCVSTLLSLTQTELRTPLRQLLPVDICIAWMGSLEW